MIYLNFDCPSCGQNLEAPENMAGQEIQCPACSHVLVIPHPPPGAEATPDNEVATPEPGIHEQEQEEFQKSSTVRMEIPDEYRKPAPSQRIVKIKRLGK